MSAARWARIASDIFEHPRTGPLEPLALLLHLRGICYAVEHLTDGRIPERLARVWASEYGEPEALLGALLYSQVWRVTDSGFEVRGFSEYNELRADAIEREERRSRAGRIGAQARWDAVRMRSECDPPASAIAPSPLPTNMDVSSAIATDTLIATEPRNTTPKDEGLEEAWALCLQYHPGIRRTEKRVSHLRRRLKEYGLKDVLDAIHGLHVAPWIDNPKSVDVGIAIRAPEQVERYRDLWRERQARAGSAARVAAEEKERVPDAGTLAILQAERARRAKEQER